MFRDPFHNSARRQSKSTALFRRGYVTDSSEAVVNLLQEAGSIFDSHSAPSDPPEC